MNYLGHLYFAKPTADSHFGNLLGDFRKGVDVRAFNHAVQRGLDKHYLIDKFTDQHPDFRYSKQLFRAQHRRFAPVALDILYDHFLIVNWSSYQDQCHAFKDAHPHSFEHFAHHSYQLLAQRLELMPARMQTTIKHMIANHGLAGYASPAGVFKAIAYVANRIRFSNSFHESVEDIEMHYEELAERFERFFPQLIAHVASKDPEA